MAAVKSKSVERAVAKILSDVGEVAVLPQIVYKIIALTGNTMTAAQEIEKAISIDPGFSSKVLMLVNSAYYALPKKMTSIREAVTFLGYRTVRQLAMTLGVFDMFVGKTDAGSLRRRELWRHSVDTAACARTLASMVPAIADDDAYTCGLLHDIGKALLDRSKSGSYCDVDAKIKEGLDPLEAEQEVFGCTHTELAGAAAANWGFPQLLKECVGKHHGPAEGDYKQHIAMTCLANEIAHAILAGRAKESSEKTDNNSTTDFSSWAVEALDFGEEKLTLAYERCKTAMANQSAMGL